jgi:hypothetical protein
MLPITANLQAPVVTPAYGTGPTSADRDHLAQIPRPAGCDLMEPAFAESQDAERQAALTSSWHDGTMGLMITPDTAQTHPTLLSAAARFDELSLRDALASMAEEEAAGSGCPLAREEALELLALGEVIARKAAYGRQLTVRSARTAGASWSQVGAALGISKQAAWEAHSQWIEGQAEQHRRNGCGGMDADMADAARTLAGQPDAP